MSNFFYSAAGNAVYDGDDRELYAVWPDDCVALTDEQFLEFFGTERPEGKIIRPDADGHPAWADIPPLTPDEQAAANEGQRQYLMTQAQNTISVWQTELQLGIISDDDKKTLTEWVVYIQKSRTVDTSVAVVEWPESPQG